MQESNQPGGRAGRIMEQVGRGEDGLLLLIEGERAIQVNRDLQKIKLSGEVRPRDVQRDNTVLSSAIANAQQKEGFGGDVERLFVSACYAGQGPTMKRIRPAPMGRAFRVVKRTAHLTVHVTERPQAVPAAAPVKPVRPRAAKSQAAATKKAAAK